MAKLDQVGLDRLAMLHKLWRKGRSGGKPLRLAAYDLSGLDPSAMDLALPRDFAFDLRARCASTASS